MCACVCACFMSRRGRSSFLSSLLPVTIQGATVCYYRGGGAQYGGRRARVCASVIPGRAGKGAPPPQMLFESSPHIELFTRQAGKGEAQEEAVSRGRHGACLLPRRQQSEGPACLSRQVACFPLFLFPSFLLPSRRRTGWSESFCCPVSTPAQKPQCRDQTVLPCSPLLPCPCPLSQTCPLIPNRSCPIIPIHVSILLILRGGRRRR